MRINEVGAVPGVAGAAPLSSRIEERVVTLIEQARGAAPRAIRDAIDWCDLAVHGCLAGVLGRHLYPTGSLTPLIAELALSAAPATWNAIAFKE